MKKNKKIVKISFRTKIVKNYFLCPYRSRKYDNGKCYNAQERYYNSDARRGYRLNLPAVLSILIAHERTFATSLSPPPLPLIIYFLHSLHLYTPTIITMLWTMVDIFIDNLTNQNSANGFAADWPQIRVHLKRCARQKIMNEITSRAQERERWANSKEREKEEGGKKWGSKPGKSGRLPIGAGKVDQAELARKGLGWLVGTSACADFMMFFDATARPSRLRQRDGAEMNSRVQLPIRFSDSGYRTDRSAEGRRVTMSPSVCTLFSQNTAELWLWNGRVHLVSVIVIV